MTLCQLQCFCKSKKWKYPSMLAVVHHKWSYLPGCLYLHSWPTICLLLSWRSRLKLGDLPQKSHLGFLKGNQDCLVFMALVRIFSSFLDIKHTGVSVCKKCYRFLMKIFTVGESVAWCCIALLHHVRESEVIFLSAIPANREILIDIILSTTDKHMNLTWR